ncbi:MAG: 3-isopropylmalate dehydrogenase [Propionibacteriaceae bacterium]|nr:3-isopropylmalate dehydrogenase [Propionibacteriaceae bacterium]
MPTGLTTFKVGVIAGDGIGPEVTAEAVKVLKAIAPVLDFTDFDLGASHWQATGEVLNDDTLAELDGQDAILLGAVGAAPGSTQIPSGLLERGLLLKLRFAFDQGLNIRPNILYPGVVTPLAPAIVARGPIDFVVVREGTEGLYDGVGGGLRHGTPGEIAIEVSVNTEPAIERCVRDAFVRATNRQKATDRRPHVTLLHKHNVLTFAGGLWRRVFDRVGAADFPDVERDYLHIDAATIAMVQDPQRFDVIVTDNLFGDIITDLAAAVTGGIGLAASANINPTGQHPSMFEPIHGSAPDIAGQQLADPTAAILSASMLLDHLGMKDEARRIADAVRADITSRGAAPRTTSQIGDAILAAL